MKLKAFCLCLFTALAASIGVFASDVNAAAILSPNENLAGAEKFPVETAVDCITEGKYITDAVIQKNKDKLFDGDTGTQIISEKNAEQDAYASITFKWNEQVQITGVDLWYLHSSTSNIGGYEVYVSNGNDNFTKIAYQEDASAVSARTRRLNFTATDNIYAREMKIIIFKKQGCESMQISELAVYGGACEFETENVNKKYHYEREEPFLSDDDIYKADPDCDALSKENYYMTKTSSGDHISLIYEFDDYYQVDRVEVTGDGDGIEMMQSADGARYFTNGYASFKSRKAVAYAAAGKNARYIKIVVQKDKSYLLGLDHIDIYARKVYDSSEVKANTLGAVPLRCELKSNNLVYLDWTGYNGAANKAVRYNVYISKSPLTAANIKNQGVQKVFYGGNPEYTTNITEKFVSSLSLEPNEDYYIAVLPVSQDGTVGTEFNAVKIHTYDQLGSGSISSLFCWNDYPYLAPQTDGINNRPPSGPYSDNENINLKLKLTSEMEGISRNRWYNQTDEMYRRYGANGVAFLPMATESGISLNNSFSNYTFQCLNEPNIVNNAEETANAIKDSYSLIKSRNEKNILAGPTIGVADRDLAHFQKLYETAPDINDYYDVLDIHPYVQQDFGNMPGTDGPVSVPEHIDKFIANLENVRSTYNIDKPVIFSEFGWCTATDHVHTWWAELLSQEQQAKYIPRYYIMAMEHDYIKNMYLYAFQDMSYLTTDAEYQFGIVDFYGNPKKSYYTYYTMVKMLKDAYFVERMPNDEGNAIAYPTYAYRFRDEKRNNNIIAVWDASDKGAEVTLSSEDEITVVDSYGSTETVPDGGGIKIDGNVKYVMSHGAIDISMK